MNCRILATSVVVTLLLVAVRSTTANDAATEPENPPKAAKAHPASQPAYLDKEHAPKGKGWTALFNGKDLTGWQSLPKDRPNSWKVENGVLVNTSKEHDHGTNLCTDRKYWDYEIYYEYCVPENGNSGVYLRGQYEIQILDDYGVPSDKPKHWGNGGICNQKTPSKNASKPAGEWQSGYARIIGEKISVFINGQQVIEEFVPPKQGDPKGPILLQGDQTPIKFRCVFIKPTKGAIIRRMLQDMP